MPSPASLIHTQRAREYFLRMADFFTLSNFGSATTPLKQATDSQTPSVLTDTEQSFLCRSFLITISLAPTQLTSQVTTAWTVLNTAPRMAVS